MTAPTPPMPRRELPCPVCPVRADNATNPEAKFPTDRWERLRATVEHPDGGGPRMESPLFGCHKGTPGATGADLGCAGWLAVFGHRHPQVRLAVATGRLPAKALDAGENWPPLHQDWETMVTAQTLGPGDPTDHLDDLGDDYDRCSG